MKNSQKGSTAVVLLVIIVIVLLGVIGWMNFKQSTQINQISDTSGATNQETRSAPTNSVPTTQNVANNAQPSESLKTYSDTRLGFSINYPASWQSPFKGWAGGWTAGTSIDNNNYCVIDTGESSMSEASDLLGKGYTQTSVKIGEVDGIRLTANPSKAGLTEAVYLTYGSYTIRIGRNRGTGSNIESDCVNSFNQALSSLKFTK